MEGGLTRQRAYLWLTATLMMVVLVIIIVYRQPSGISEASNHEQNINDESVYTESAASYTYSRFTDKVSDNKSQPINKTYSHSTSHAPEQPPTTIYHKDKQLIFNLNTADSLDLVQLYNIGPAFAHRIIRYRTLLGGFVDKRQLWEVRGMDSVRYNDIAPYLYADPSDITKIDLNNVTLDQLKRHPYLDYYQAKAIVQLRNALGSYHNIEELLKIPIIDNETYTHIAPYLTCNSQPSK